VQKYTFLGYKKNASDKSTIPEAIDITTGTANTVIPGSKVVISNANNNANLWVPFTGPDGNILAEVYANGNDLGEVTSAFYLHSGATRIAGGRKYLNRNITITPTNQPLPGQPVMIRLYISKAEFDALDADGGSAVNQLEDLRILKNQDACGGTILSSTTVLTPDHWDAHGADAYVLQYNDLTGFSSFYFGANSVLLPLHLLTFKAALQANSTALLQWEAEPDPNTSFFIVERSADGRNYTSIGKVPVASEGEKAYSFTDNRVNEITGSTIYYRLKITGQDGTVAYSNVIVVSLSSVAGDILVAPNPAVNETRLTIAARVSGTAQWKLYDNAGRVVMQGTESLVKGTNIITISLARIPAGVYYLQVSGKGVEGRVKLQKSN
jgi:hypothetical protein